MTHIRQSRPDSGLGFYANDRETFSLVSSWLESGAKLIPQNVLIRGFRKSTPTQNRQLIILISDSKQ